VVPSRTLKGLKNDPIKKSKESLGCDFFARVRMYVRTSTFFGFFVHVCRFAKFFFRMGVSFVYLST
jgi:hypothetical protein